MKSDIEEARDLVIQWAREWQREGAKGSSTSHLLERLSHVVDDLIKAEKPSPEEVVIEACDFYGAEGRSLSLFARSAVEALREHGYLND